MKQKNEGKGAVANITPFPVVETARTRAINHSTYDTMMFGGSEELLSDFRVAKSQGSAAVELVALRAFLSIAILEEYIGQIAVIPEGGGS